MQRLFILLSLLGFALMAESGPTEGPMGGFAPTGSPCYAAETPAPPDVPSYADVASIFNRSCIMCHSGPHPPLGLRLDSYPGIMKGSQNGPVIKAGAPEESELMRRIRGISQPRMPFGGPPWLSNRQIALIENWIAAGVPEGAPEARSEPTAAPVAESATKNGIVTYAQVEPIFRMRCVKCHMSGGMMGAPPEGLRLDSYASALESRERAWIVPGFPEASELVRRIRGQSRPRMPFDGPPYLEQTEIETIVSWVDAGAPDGNGEKAALPVGARVRLGGTLTQRWELNGMPLTVDGGTRLKKNPKVGDYVEVRGTVRTEGRISATRIRPRN